MSPQAKGVTNVRNDALGNDMLVGVGSGALAGGLWGLSCGPFAALCVPLGAAAGFVTGAAAGAVVGVTGELSENKISQLRARFIRMQQTHALLTELQSNLIDRARGLWNLTSEPPTTVVTVELQDLLLTSTRDERVSCVVLVQVAVQPGGADRAASTRQKLYEYVGPFSSLALWLDEASPTTDTCFSSASQNIAAQIISDLAGN